MAFKPAIPPIKRYKYPFKQDNSGVGLGHTLDAEFSYFLSTDLSEYKDGEWIAIYNKKIISHGEKLKKVVEATKKSGVPLTKVLLSKVKKTASYL